MNKVSTERRRDPRSVCSVMSEVLVISPSGHAKYFAPAILADISASGLSLIMDTVPRGANKLKVRNTYFEVDVYIRHTNATDAGFCIGCELSHSIEWLPERILQIGRF